MTRIVLLAICFISIAAAQSLDGFWQSQGYGFVFQFQGPALKAFELTTRTCMPGLTAKRSTNAAPGSEAAFQTKGGDLYFIRAGGSPDHKLLHYDGAASDIHIDRVPHLPTLCDKPTANTPLENFEVFTRTWAEHYIAFDLKRTDWEKVVSQNRSKVTPQTTPTQLFEI